MTDSAINVLTNLSALPTDDYLLAEAYIQQLLSEQFPDRDFGVGSGMYWSVVIPSAAAITAWVVNSRLVSAGMNLSALRANPENVSEALADLTLSNYYVSRDDGAVSRGTALYVVDRLATYVAREGDSLSYFGHEYTVSATIYAYPDQAQVGGPEDRYLVPRADGRWQFSVPVQAVETGTGSFAAAGVMFQAANLAPGVVAILAETDISGGVDEQSLPDLLAQIPSKFAASTWGSRATTRAMVTELYPQANVGITGFGDPEMLRDKHNPLSMSLGGFSDVWASTQQTVGRATLTVEAELVDVGGTWRASLSVEEAAGIYQIRSVARSGGPALTVIDRARSWDVPDRPGAPLIYTDNEAAFSAYQTLTVDFEDTDDLPALGETRNYDLSVVYMPGIAELTAQLTSPEALDPTVNVLVRGVVPCLTSVSLSVRLLDSDFEDSIDVAGIRDAIVSRVNRVALGFGVMSSSIIQDSVMNYLSGRSDIGGTTVTLRGEILAPDGSSLILGDDRELTIPDMPARQVTKNTAKFFTDNSLIDVRFERVNV